MNHCKANASEERRTGSFSSDTFEDIVDEGVKNSHRLIGDTSIRVDLLEDCKSRENAFRPEFEH